MITTFLNKNIGEVENNKIPDHPKYITTSEFNEFSGSRFNTKLKQGNLATNSDADAVWYNGKYLKTKIKHYESKVCKNFDDDRIPKEGFHFICLSLILIDSVLKAGKSYYSQVFFEEYIIKEKRWLDILLMT